MITSADVIRNIELTNEEINECFDNAKHIAPYITDRGDLQERDLVERFIHVLQGEIAEKIVIKWLESNKKYVESAVDKKSTNPDLGHDINIKKADDGSILRCSIKSSLSVSKGIDSLVSEFTLATTQRELRDVNIQVYFWLDIHGNFNNSRHRHNFLKVKNSAIIGWVSSNDITNFQTYANQERQSPKMRLQNMRKMEDLLQYLAGEE